MPYLPVGRTKNFRLPLLHRVLSTSARELYVAFATDMRRDDLLIDEGMSKGKQCEVDAMKCQFRNRRIED